MDSVDVRMEDEKGWVASYCLAAVPRVGDYIYEIVNTYRVTRVTWFFPRKDRACVTLTVIKE